MLKVPTVQATLMQFPWGRIESDTSFSNDVARGRFGVLGATGFGFWSHRGGPASHLVDVDDKNTNRPSYMNAFVKSFDYMDGTTLLENKHLGDKDGWKLEPELIPFREFSAEQAPPQLAAKVDIKDWDSWYRWRGLPKESIAILLMNFPLSVYWLIVNTLQLTNPKAGSNGKRIKLNLQYIGAETELNFLPLYVRLDFLTSQDIHPVHRFSELALLLPHTDIKLVLFGMAVKNLVDKAKKSHPKSLAGKASPPTPVFEYTAPEQNGSGTIQIFLHREHKEWSPADADAKLSKYGKPDAMVALNAGLGTYNTWNPLIVWTHATNMPFAVTEYAEQSCETQRNMVRHMLYTEAMKPGSVLPPGPGVPPMGEAAWSSLGKTRGFKIEMNPFQGPGQRPIPTRVPSVLNGFTICVVGKDDMDLVPYSAEEFSPSR